MVAGKSRAQFNSANCAVRHVDSTKSASKTIEICEPTASFVTGNNSSKLPTKLPAMSLEKLVTRLEVTHKGELYIALRGLGGIHFPNWKHLYHSEILGRHSKNSYHYVWGDAYKNYTDMRIKILDNPAFAHAQDRLKKKYWWVYQVFCHPSVQDQLPTIRTFQDGKYKMCGFHTDGKTKQARRRLRHPGVLAPVSEQMLEALEAKRITTERLTQLNTAIGDTRTINDLDVIFDLYDECPYEKLERLLNEGAFVRKLPEDVISERRDIAEFMKQFPLTNGDQFRLRYQQKNRNQRNHELTLIGRDWSFMNEAHMGDVNFYMNLQWLFLDIEIPHFRRENPQVTWAGVRSVRPAEIISEIYTVYGEHEENIADYTMKVFPTVRDMHVALTERINQLDPDVVSPYNARFDLIKLRETESGFAIGENESDPLFKATAPFFERIGIHDRFVIDFMRYQRMARAHDPNAKLEMAAGLTKISSYDDLEADEDKAIAGDRRAIEQSATYLAGDVTATANIKDHPDFRNHLEDIVWLCERYNLGWDRVLHSLTSVQEFQEYLFFKIMGTDRDRIPPNIRYKNSQKRREQANATFQRHVVNKCIDKKRRKGVKGLHADVYKVLIPTGDILSDALIRRCPELEDFFDYKDMHRSDKSRLQFLEKIANAFASWLITDYGFFIREVRNLYSLLKKKGVSIHNDPYQDDFEEDYHTLRRALEMHDLKKLNEARIGMRAVESYLGELELYLLETHDISVKEMAEASNLRSKIKRVGRRMIGNYDVFPDHRYFQPEKRRREPGEILVLEDLIAFRFYEIEKFIELHGIEVIAQEGSYVYVKDPKGALQRVEAPLVVADVMESVYNADNVYYKKNGYYSHHKVKDEATNSACVNEMRTLGSILDNLLDGFPEQALEWYTETLHKIEAHDVPLEDLLFYNKTKARYSAYVVDSESPRGDIMFVESFPEQDENSGVPIKLFTDEHSGRQYYVEGTRKIKGGVEEEVKVWVMSREDLNIDYEAYFRRFYDKGRVLLKPAVDKNTANLLWGKTRKENVIGDQDSSDDNQLFLDF